MVLKEFSITEFWEQWAHGLITTGEFQKLTGVSPLIFENKTRESKISERRIIS